MKGSAKRGARLVAATLCLTAPSVFAATDFAAAERLFAEHCAVCHGADRGGYIGPALNRDETKLSPAEVNAKIQVGTSNTLMPQHPVWPRRLTAAQRESLAALITQQPRRELDWGMEDIRKSLAVLADEAKLPAKPVYRIGDLDDLMAVMGRGHYAAGKDAKVVFFDGRTHKKVGEVPTGHAPHLMDFHPREPRWAYVRDDMGWIHKIDLYSLKTVRKVRAGLNGISLALSRDGRYLAAGSYVPHTAVIFDAATLEPLKLLRLAGTDPDGRMVESDSGMITGTPFADLFAIALEQSGQVWIMDLDKPDLPVTRITDVGRHLHDAFLSPDGRRLVVASYDDHVNTVIDLAERRIVTKIPSGCKPHLGSGAVVESKGRLLGIGTNIGEEDCKAFEVTVFDMQSYEVVKRIPVAGPTESPAAHPKSRYIAVDIVGSGPNANLIQFIDKEHLDVVKTLAVAGTMGHSHFPEFTARGDFIYVSARGGGDRTAGLEKGRVVVIDSATLDIVKRLPVDVPAGVFSRVRARAVVVGMQPEAR
ncbi:MAG TPA: cytochrome D1 domain-containing protein [Candidatus Desulfobacillus sp.]|nr:cytochrome D1 domain-containing protein [Candidatus Desulfobacillus sp.]